MDFNMNELIRLGVDPKTGMDLGDTKSFFNRRNRPDIKTVQQVDVNSQAIRKGR